LSVAVEVRVAGEGDLAALAALRKSWNDEHQARDIDDPTFESKFAAWVVAEAPTRTFFLAELDGVAIGMANVKRYDRMPAAGMESAGWWGYVGNVFVLPEHRNGGAGAALMEALQAWAWEHGYEHLRLAPSTKAVPFYDRLGYVAGHVVQLDP
jgi:GNAT superfamily N-acetyltransferase